MSVFLEQSSSLLAAYLPQLMGETWVRSSPFVLWLLVLIPVLRRTPVA